MSFSEKLIAELMDAELQKTCCRKSMLFGLFFGAQPENENIIRADFRSYAIALRAAEILKRQFSASPEITEVRRAGRCFYSVSAVTRALCVFLKKADREEGTLAELVGFRCPECAHAFLRGVFVSSGTVTDPQKGYHLEFVLQSEARSHLLGALLEKEVGVAKSVLRGSRIGLYYKKNMMIADILYYLGGTQSGFDFANMCIEHDIRNGENRATNCVAKNISRAVDAAVKHISAIETLASTGKLSRLGDEIEYTARLRLENPSMSLSELALIHEPPISKSGLNRRLARIIAEAEDIEKCDGMSRDLK